MSESIVIDPVLYWKLRALAADHRALVERCQAQIAQSQTTLNATLEACGLVLGKNYDLNDAACSAKEQA